ncbi:restriction endonuclease [Gammaproteobacteria bacterium]|nr:restriction endonuclease [Gammaproteobacteria bacterium]
MKIIPNDKLEKSDLVIDAIYEGTENIRREPISTLLEVPNQSGFRKKGDWRNPSLVVLYSSMEDDDWPDNIDQYSGIFTYYGDNKTPGNPIHETSKKGNKILLYSFERAHDLEEKNSIIPPFFIFTKHPTSNSSRSVQFRGLAVPGNPSLSQTQDLVAIWKSTHQGRFQNYQAKFSILNIGTIKRRWLDDLINGKDAFKNAPDVWKQWILKKNYNVLTSSPVLSTRKTEQQIPDNKLKRDLIDYLHQRYAHNPTKFEPFAANWFVMFDKRAKIDEITQASVDGGRDAMGTYRLGLTKLDPVNVTFYLEAKLYAPENSVGVRETSRLISRIRNRQFGVLITTSYIAPQAYKEIREDNHPIILICGKDIADTLVARGYNSIEKLRNLCESIDLRF